ncbi:MAG: undecaprenyldiphospho-muramoylpentapeptide beta-N-acetylglucosaminyltransferase [Bernardetiaceae bacterium]|nr:undecaprenyldiphospho-muramoylpentapeptide beta-N-acetylglucosaminyltransferase [Bernardetiaceae bacterium]
MKLRVIISGGGTGGHIYPGIAIAKKIKDLEPQSDILFVGAKGKMEMEKVPKAGFPIEGLPIRGLQRKLTLSNISFPFRLAASLWQADRIIRRFSPHIVIGTGGYASGAMLQVATWHKIPTLIQEQNNYAGLTNRLLAKKVSIVCVAYPNMEKHFPNTKIALTGNPVRQDLENIPETAAQARAFFQLNPDLPTVLVMGGSGGALRINNCIRHGIEKMIEAGAQLIWQTGANYYPEIKSFLEANPPSIPERIFVSDFIYDMPKAYRAADLIVARAGALTVAELAIVGKASILVPSPNVVADHQNKNATVLADAQAALLVKDNQAETMLMPHIISLLSDNKKRDSFAQAIRQFAFPQAALNIAELALALRNAV